MRTSVLSTISQSKSNISARLVQIKEIIMRSIEGLIPKEKIIIEKVLSRIMNSNLSPQEKLLEVKKISENVNQSNQQNGHVKEIQRIKEIIRIIEIKERQNEDRRKLSQNMFEDNKKSENKFGESINELSNDNFNINSNYNLNVPNSNMKKGTFKSLLNDSNLLSEKEIKRNQRISDMKMKEEELKNKLKSLKQNFEEQELYPEFQKTMVSRNQNKDDYSHCSSSKQIIDEAMNNVKHYKSKYRKKRKRGSSSQEQRPSRFKIDKEKLYYEGGLKDSSSEGEFYSSNSIKSQNKYGRDDDGLKIKTTKYKKYIDGKGDQDSNEHGYRQYYIEGKGKGKRKKGENDDSYEYSSVSVSSISVSSQSQHEKQGFSKYKGKQNEPHYYNINIKGENIQKVKNRNSKNTTSNKSLTKSSKKFINNNSKEQLESLTSSLSSSSLNFQLKSDKSKSKSQSKKGRKVISRNSKTKNSNSILDPQGQMIDDYYSFRNTQERIKNPQSDIKNKKVKVKDTNYPKTKLQGYNLNIGQKKKYQMMQRIKNRIMVSPASAFPVDYEAFKWNKEQIEQRYVKQSKEIKEIVRLVTGKMNWNCGNPMQKKKDFCISCEY